MGTSTPVTVEINGDRRTFTLDNRTTLLDLLREHAGLTGTKKGCDHGQCGACTVLVNGRRENACLRLAVSADGERITTVEGLAHDGRLHPLQRAFVDLDAFQCGYCTPGQLCSAVGAIDEAARGWPSAVTAPGVPDGPVALTDTEVRERMSGNLCRCGAYPHIVDAVQEVGAR
ncbi:MULTISPECIES: 2Fe-2S iron-sulfur cluster-binding protein [Streptomycetaceae]|uniref:Xanthine dehydrogenase n=1 Tax=Streptantibioticus cattleyicolor (strain ATCC 35852 / DSM 46488 / JCM 4925 / NBRC 14057 / NRRL 8057) TaxID=1003195 RepID=F8JRM4_STREN|nr:MULTISPECIES: 2Fe-2S iron-sulfur cluster-binding protein [Streptomycetaceae]AEW97908.1 xanthine dehydrogenase [Streptantibioticus cattleyicolor NRRL 8057 = DSM 46488]MYS62315.1 2Fe-2S iron-sulfur cluster binding domain-containing protein [Streptomyces sp. SID5468]CCB78225.1 (2Fe-2S)-binding domain-containing protein [Streptantibioticus cattleyicolor NRRL 8057 = DSM 46488]